MLKLVGGTDGPEVKKMPARIAPLPESVCVLLRKIIKDSQTVEEAGRNLRVDILSILRGAAGARLHINTRTKILRALKKEGYDVEQ